MAAAQGEAPDLNGPAAGSGTAGAACLRHGQAAEPGAGHHPAGQRRDRRRVLLLWHQQHFISAWDLSLGDLHTCAEIRAHSAGNYRS